MNHREVMQQALEALELSTPKPRVGDDDYAEQGWEEHHAAITALKAALAEPTGKDDLQVEPVAWMYEHDGMVHDAANPPFFAMNRWKTPVGEPYTETPLYTHPAPQREPLTDEQIMDLMRDMSIEMRWPSTPLDIARAIEKAHGIGGQDEVQS